MIVKVTLILIYTFSDAFYARAIKPLAPKHASAFLKTILAIETYTFYTEIVPFSQLKEHIYLLSGSTIVLAIGDLHLRLGFTQSRIEPLDVCLLLISARTHHRNTNRRHLKVLSSLSS